MLAFLAASWQNSAAAPETSGEKEPPAIARLSPGRLLVATGAITAPPFHRSVALITIYSEQEGAVGLIINRPTQYPLSSVLPEIESLRGSGEMLYYGGPVSPRVMAVLVESDENLEENDGVFRVFGNVFFAVNKKVIHDALKGKEKPARGYAGYAGWAPGQLEEELARGDWSVEPATSEAVFSLFPDALWEQLRPGGKKELWTMYIPRRLK